jgi:hypothetical protein
MASPEAVRQALIQRVSRKVSGHGVTRRSIESAVDRVLAALPTDLSAPSTPPRIAVLSAPSAPDLASRARRLLEREGVRVLAIGTGTAGRHTVATIRFAAEGGVDLQRIATTLGASLSMLDDADARQVTA